jgi:hypothetical protein
MDKSIPKSPRVSRVDDVEAAASVHEDLGEPGVADDRIDNERVPSWARHAVGVVALVEGDGLVGPVQVDWRHHLHRADLPALLLAVPSRGVRHLPTIDHEAAVDLGELLFLVALLLVVVLAFAISRWWPGLMEVAPKHDAFLEGVLDGTLVIGARLLEYLVEQVGPPGDFRGFLCSIAATRSVSAASRFACDFFLAFFFVPRWADASGTSSWCRP